MGGPGEIRTDHGERKKESGKGGRGESDGWVMRA